MNYYDMVADAAILADAKRRYEQARRDAMERRDYARAAWAVATIAKLRAEQGLLWRDMDEAAS